MKRWYKEIDIEILRILKKRTMSINEICKSIKANWSTTDKHLQHLEKIGIVKKITNKKRLKLYELSE